MTLFFLLSHCTKEDGPNLSPVLEEAFNIAQNNSLHRLTINWSELREKVSQADKNGDFEQAIRVLLRGLADNHSFYRTADGSFYSESDRLCTGSGYDFTGLPDDIGYLQVRDFSGSQQQSISLANAIQNRIREQDSLNLKGWVVDLTLNLGGNMYPMIAGLGPLYTQETLGYFIDSEGLENRWGYSGGGSFLGDPEFSAVQVDSLYILSDPDAKVVVVIGNRTASSGEATAISFIGRPNTLFLGRPTCGASTANRTFNLSNGDTFILTVATMADRNKQPYGEEILPDEAIDSSDALKARIIEWLDE